MAHGVPETDVFAAADRVLARGERPTVERVRAELGRGSPARVGQLLDTWWDALAQRLAGQTRLPQLPGDVAQAFTAVWATAFEQARAIAHTELAAERSLLAQQVDASRHEQAVSESRATAAIADAEGARAALAHSERRVADLETLAESRAQQVSALERQGAAQMMEVERLTAALAAAQRHGEDERQRATAERAALNAHVQAVENRAHAEIDRTREEIKAFKRDLASVQRELQLAAKAVRDAQTAQHAADRRAAVAEARLAQSTAGRATTPRGKAPPATTPKRSPSPRRRTRPSS